MTATSNTPPTPSAVVRESDRLFRAARRRFIADLVAGLAARGVRAVVASRGTVAAWADPGPHLGLAGVLEYTWPTPERPDVPLTTRIAIDQGYLPVPRRVVRDLSLPAAFARSFDPPHLDGLELTTLPGELADFAAWVADWIVCRHAPRPAAGGAAAPGPEPGRRGPAADEVRLDRGGRRRVRRLEGRRAGASRPAEGLAGGGQGGGGGREVGGGRTARGRSPAGPGPSRSAPLDVSVPASGSRLASAAALPSWPTPTTEATVAS